MHIDPVRLHGAKHEGARRRPGLPALERARRPPPTRGDRAQIDRHGELQARRRPRAAPPFPVERRERDDDAVAPEGADAERAARWIRGTHHHRAEAHDGRPGG